MVQEELGSVIPLKRRMDTVHCSLFLANMLTFLIQRSACATPPSISNSFPLCLDVHGSKFTVYDARMDLCHDCMYWVRGKLHGKLHNIRTEKHNVRHVSSSRVHAVIFLRWGGRTFPGLRIWWWRRPRSRDSSRNQMVRIQIDVFLAFTCV